MHLGVSWKGVLLGRGLGRVCPGAGVLGVCVLGGMSWGRVLGRVSCGSVSWGGVLGACPGGVCPAGVSPWGVSWGRVSSGVWPGGVCPGCVCPGGVSPGGVSWGPVLGVCVCPAGVSPGRRVLQECLLGACLLGRVLGVSPRACLIGACLMGRVLGVSPGGVPWGRVPGRASSGGRGGLPGHGAPCPVAQHPRAGP